ncbi:hypothetical protein Peur_001939 [Populus x canadensis]
MEYQKRIRIEFKMKTVFDLHCSGLQKKSAGIINQQGKLDRRERSKKVAEKHQLGKHTREREPKLEELKNSDITVLNRL